MSKSSLNLFSRFNTFMLVKRLWSSELRPLAKTAIGTSEFGKLVNTSTVIVDKTLLIKDFLENSSENTLITYPRRWGKSLNLDMLKNFLAFEVDYQGNEIANPKNYDLFFDPIRPLKISKAKISKVEKGKLVSYPASDLCGKSPVIHIDFKDTKADTFEEVVSKLKTQIHHSFNQHRYLSQSSKLRDYRDDKAIEKYIHPTHYKELSIEDVQQGLRLLSEVLYRHFDKKVYVLMDEYDAAINHSYIRASDRESEKIINLFRNINETTFKSNPYLDKGLITGVFRIAKANLFSGLNNLSESGITDSEYSQFYGFTHEEVEYLLSEYKVPSSLAKDIKSWYNGYNIGKTQIYNPWSIVKCLNAFQKNKGTFDNGKLRQEILQNYWEESGNIDFTKGLFKYPIIKKKVDSLVSDTPIIFSLSKQISSSDFKVLKEVVGLGSNYEINEATANILFSYLLSAGYLTPDGDKGFKLPNNEIKNEFEKKLREYYEQTYSVDPKLFAKVTDQIQGLLDSKDEIEGAITKIKTSIQKLLLAFPEFTKITDQNIATSDLHKVVHANEEIVHSTMSYIALQVKSISKFGTEIKLGKGRADIVFTDGKSKKAVVIELKYANDPKSLIESSEEALAQINDRQYAKSLFKNYDVIKMGISVSGTEVEIAHETTTKKSFFGRGSQEDYSYDLPYNKWFNEYYNEGIEKILKLRVESLDIASSLKEKIKILPAKYQLKDGVSSIPAILKDIEELKVKEEDTILNTYNIENKHWVGFIFNKVKEGFKVTYIDPENKKIDSLSLNELKQDLEKAGQKLIFNQQFVETQRYNNCGPELIEHMAYHLSHTRIPENEAVLFHSMLLEQELLGHSIAVET